MSLCQSQDEVSEQVIRAIDPLLTSNIGIKDFFLASPMSEPEYMRMHISYIPADIRDTYNLDEKISNEYNLLIITTVIKVLKIPEFYPFLIVDRAGR